MARKRPDDAADLLGLLDRRERDGYKARIAEQQKQIDHLSERLEKLRASRWAIPLGRRKAAKAGRVFTRVVVPDTHGCFVDVPAIAAFLDDLEALQPAEIVMLGDHLECGGFLAQHWTLGYVAQAEYTFEQDVDAANDLLDKIQARAPRAAIHYLQGNHERRIEQWCITQALRHSRDGAYLLRQFGCDAQLNLSKRGIALYEQGKTYMGLKIPATIKLGHCYFTHGHTAAKHAAAKMLERYKGNVVFGHTHRSDEASTNTVSDGTIKAYNPGCLCQMQPLWQHTNPTEWSHGYAVQFVQEDGSFLHVNVTIIDGRSYLAQVTKRAA
ncbi:MAG TPA: metallophosphoesterase family protein [bacterium]|nr:metallophosphoesterase family protein [bacterium]